MSVTSAEEYIINGVRRMCNGPSTCADALQAGCYDDGQAFYPCSTICFSNAAACSQYCPDYKETFCEWTSSTGDVHPVIGEPVNPANSLYWWFLLLIPLIAASMTVVLLLLCPKCCGRPNRCYWRNERWHRRLHRLCLKLQGNHVIAQPEEGIQLSEQLLISPPTDAVGNERIGTGERIGIGERMGGEQESRIAV